MVVEVRLRQDVNIETTLATSEGKSEADQIRGLMSCLKPPCCICIVLESAVLSSPGSFLFSWVPLS